MRRVVIPVVLCVALSGCGGGAMIALNVLAGLASAATIANDIAGIDVSLSQQAPGKIPMSAVFAPPPPPR